MEPTFLKTPKEKASVFGNNKVTVIRTEEDVFIDNQEFVQMMKICKRTAQKWRSIGKIPYFIIGKKTYYNKADVYSLIQSGARLKGKSLQLEETSTIKKDVFY